MRKDSEGDGEVLTSPVQIAQHLLTARQSNNTSDDKSRQTLETTIGGSSPRRLFLSCVAWTFVVAFWSYYTSFPGLISSSGIEPVTRVLPSAAPTIHRHLIATGRIDADSLCELSSLVGLTVACLVACGLVQHGLLFLIMTGIYSFLTRTGSVFYSFQWDTLLLETGFVVGLCYAPWLHLRPSSAAHAGVWPLRFLLFKLMFMSGVVKIQAACPTWIHMTALEYHFATQCLPGPLAWYAHQLHPLLLRLAVAATLVIEIPLAFLLLAPSFAIRRLSAMCQIVLQVSIVLTGNYTFFNLLTMAMCLPCMERDMNLLFLPDSATTKQYEWLAKVVFWAFSAWSIPQMIGFQMAPPAQTWWNDLSVSLLLTKKDCNHLSEWAIPVVVLFTMALVLWNCATQLAKSRNNVKPLSVVHALVSITVTGVVAVPLCSLTPKLERGGFIGSTRIFAPLWLDYARPYRLANGYGLFRRMTGIGQAPGREGGWAGQPPSVVERPEIVLEGVFEGEDPANDRWYELSFRWKPGNTRVRPRQVAPHQPRLDWQMWFAALGEAQQNLWFLSLVQKLLSNCEQVGHLLGDARLSKRRLTKLRAKLYYYDFTRVDSEWSRGIPGVAVVNDQPDRYWSRRFARPYFAATGASDPSLTQLLSNYGYEGDCHGVEDRCRMSRNDWCSLASQFRSGSLFLVPVGLLFLHTLIQMRRRVLRWVIR